MFSFETSKQDLICVDCNIVEYADFNWNVKSELTACTYSESVNVIGKVFEWLLLEAH
jgi:hypothetical protein